MVSYVIFGIASGLFWIGTIYDAASSKGEMESTKLFADSKGRYSAVRYLGFTGGLYTLAVLFGWWQDESFTWITGAASLVGWAIARYLISKKNQRLRAQARMSERLKNNPQ